MERVLASLSFQKVDRVPTFLLLVAQGAKELGVPLKEYFKNGENISAGQERLQKKYGHDVYYPFTYAAIETEAMGQKVGQSPEGYSFAGPPLIKNLSEIYDLKEVDPNSSPILERVFVAERNLKKIADGKIPIVGVVMSPLSIPVMQLGFENYLDLIQTDEKSFDALIEYNTKFCISYANAQLEAGANAICYFDPMASPSMLPRWFYAEKGLKIAKRVLSQIQGPAAIHLASGITDGIAEELKESGSPLLGFSCKENISAMKKSFGNKMALLGNMNGIEMRTWDSETTKKKVSAILAEAGESGFILSDNHGEIPASVPEIVLFEIMECVKNDAAIR